MCPGKCCASAPRIPRWRPASAAAMRAIRCRSRGGVTIAPARIHCASCWSSTPPWTCQAQPPKATRCSACSVAGQSRSTCSPVAMRRARVFLRRSAREHSTCCTLPGMHSSTPVEPGQGGLLCAGKEVLRGDDLAGISNLPALVFCNACEAARVRKRARVAAAPPRLFGLRRTMTGIAEAFLAGRCREFPRHALARRRRRGVRVFAVPVRVAVDRRSAWACGACRPPTARSHAHRRLGRLRSLRQSGVSPRRLAVNQRTFLAADAARGNGRPT